MKKIITIFVLTLACVSLAKADNEKQRPFSIHFKKDNAQFDPAYQNNAQTLDKIEHMLDSIGVENVIGIQVTSKSSPEGATLHNQDLSNRRADEMVRITNSRYPMYAGITSISGMGESWDELAEYVKEDKVLSEKTKQKVLAAIADTSVEKRKERLKYLGTDPAVGSINKYLVSTYYPLLRNSAIVIIYLDQLPSWDIADFEVPLDDPLELTFPVIEPIEINWPKIVPPAPKAKETLLAVKTNLLYDAVTMVNAEVEIPIGRRWSVMVEDVFPWWEFSKNKFALQNWEMGIEPRFWFRPWNYDTNKLLGHFVGAYAMSGRGDLQFDTTPNYQVHYWSAGATYGYVLPLGKKHWGNMEFSLSVGLLSADYQHYQPTDVHDMLIRDQYNAGRFTFFGPTKAKISLVIPLNFYTKRAASAKKEVRND